MGNCASSIQSLRLNMDTHVVSLSTSSNQGKALSGEIVDLAAQISRKCCCEIIDDRCGLLKNRCHVVDGRCSFDRSCWSSPLLYCVGRPLLNGSNYLFEGRQLRGDRGSDVLCCLFECLGRLNLTGITSRFDKCFTNCMNNIRQFSLHLHLCETKNREFTGNNCLGRTVLADTRGRLGRIDIRIVLNWILRSMNQKVANQRVCSAPHARLQVANRVVGVAHLLNICSVEAASFTVRRNADQRKNMRPYATFKHLCYACVDIARVRDNSCSDQTG